jgi:1-acyl-sn-glycerol-3-phosphate acyltransferase
MLANTPFLDEQPLPDPTKRDWIWLTFQYLMRIVFAVTLRYRVRGLEHVPQTGGGLLLINHQSSLDPLLAGLAINRPISYMARDTLFLVPVIGWILRRTHVVPINRDSASSRAIKALIRRMKHGFLVGMFPEGTRSQDGQMGDFKPGFIALIRRSPVPIYPVGIAGAHDAMPRGVLIPRFRRVRVVYGEPITTEEIRPYLEHRREQELVALVRERIIDCQQAAENWRQTSRLGSENRND